MTYCNKSLTDTTRPHAECKMKESRSNEKRERWLWAVEVKFCFHRLKRQEVDEVCKAVEGYWRVWVSAFSTINIDFRYRVQVGKSCIQFSEIFGKRTLWNRLESFFEILQLAWTQTTRLHGQLSFYRTHLITL